MSTTTTPPSPSPSPTPSLPNATSSCGYQSPPPPTPSLSHEVFRGPSFRKRPRPHPVPAKPDSGTWADTPKPHLGPKGDGLEEGEHWGGNVPGDGTVLAPSSGTVLGRRRRGRKRRRVGGVYAVVEGPAAPDVKAEGRGAAVGGGVDAAVLDFAEDDGGESGAGSVVSEGEGETAMATRSVRRGHDGLSAPAPAHRAYPRPPLRWQTPRKRRQDTGSKKKAGKRCHVESDDEEEEEEED